MASLAFGEAGIGLPVFMRVANPENQYAVARLFVDDDMRLVRTGAHTWSEIGTRERRLRPLGEALEQRAQIVEIAVGLV